MEVLELRAAHLSNAEVLSFLNELEVSRQQNRPVSYPGVPTQKNLNDLYTVERQVLTYLRNTPSVSQGPNEINNFMQSLKEYSLTKGEKLMLLNLRPKTTAELNPLIENMEERLQDNKQEELINIIIQQLPYEEPAAVDGDYMET